MKRLLVTLFVAGCMGVALSPSSADAGILSRLFGRLSQGTTSSRVAAPAVDGTVEAGRRYSYEPSVSRRSTSDVPRGQSHLLPKTDPRRYIPN
jgi:hypothetical protein